jgi:hypothetical protein
MIDSFFDELDKIAAMIRDKIKESDIDDIESAPSSTLMPALKQIHGLGKRSSWTEIGPVGQGKAPWK